jgi:5-methylcytosine-specific restriction endonuclease McrA
MPNMTNHTASKTAPQQENSTTHRFNVHLPRKRLDLDLKLKIREAFGWQCQYCGYICPENQRAPHLSLASSWHHDFAKHQTLHIDRITPKVDGGDYRFSNITLSCRDCNLRKGDGLPSAAVKSFLDILEAR